MSSPIKDTISANPLRSALCWGDVFQACEEAEGIWRLEWDAEGDVTRAACVGRQFATLRQDQALRIIGRYTFLVAISS